MTQQDSETNLSIAQATKNDSAAMKTIAALTMIFLPATAVSSFFGMAFFNARGDEITATSDWWLFLATTVPITVILFLIWLKWDVILHALEIIGRSTLASWPSSIRWMRRDSDSDVTRVPSESSMPGMPEKDISKIV